MSPEAVLVTGAGGYLGRQVVAALAAAPGDLKRIVALDLRPPAAGERLPGVTYETADITGPELAEVFRRHAPAVVVHLAALVTPGAASNRQREYQVDVLGSQNVLQACLACGARKIIYASSGAAYGYHADNPPWLAEDHPLRGNPEFAYSDHKRQVEEMLARWRSEHPELKQLILRPGTILGATVKNQITDLFDRRMVLGLSGAASPFVLIWDQDVVAVVVKGVFEDASGIYNLAGDGVLSLREIAQRLGKPYVPLPAWLVQGALWLLKRLGLTQYGPEQVRFLRYRPVLANQRLKQELGYIPQKTTRQVFDYFLEKRGRGRQA
ncbi:MAG: SDR family oxidoreductase [Thermodesulfobacteriota bacterium]